MNEQKYKEDLKDIKDIMERSTRIISLSGLSGISAGIMALIGAYAAYRTVYEGQDYFSYRAAVITAETYITLVLIALIVLAVSLFGGFYFTQREAKLNNETLWSVQAKRLLVNLAIPLVSGGLLCIILLSKGYVGILAPLSLIFYGLSLVSASQYTLTDIRHLGLLQILVGLVAAYFIGYGLFFWAFGFGLLHIIYGSYMHIKYKS